MPEAREGQSGSSPRAGTHLYAPARRESSATSLRELWETLVRRRRLVFSIVGGLLLACLLYCLIAPNQYEAQARVELRTSPASDLSLQSSQPIISASMLSAPVELETTAGVLRSKKLAWQVITGLKLYQVSAFAGSFARRFPGFKPDAPDANQTNIDARAWVLKRFEDRLSVETVPRTLLIRIRFRSRDAVLSALVVNTLIETYVEQDRESQVQATAQASGWLQKQLATLKAREERADEQLAAYESAHGILSSPQMLPNGQQGESDHESTLLEVDELSRQLVAATSDRILREAEYRTAEKGDPELVIASDPGLQTGDSGFVTDLLEQIQSRRSALEQQEAQLTLEDGPNFPQVVEIRRQVQDLDRQEKAEDAKLVKRFRSAWQTADDREQLLRRSLSELTGQGTSLNAATARYTAMRQEADASHALYVQVMEKVEEAGLAAGVHSSNITVVDPALPPAKPVAPNLPLYMAITFFISLWLALAAVLLAESLRPSGVRAGVVVLALLGFCSFGHAQAPTPSTSGLPTGVASFPQTPERKSVPNPKEAPPVWDGVAPANTAGTTPTAGARTAEPMPAPIAPGDSLDISEYHTPQFHSQVRVEPDGTVTLPLIGDIHLAGLDEQGAAHAIEKALVAKGMLLHPLVSVVVTVYAGQDVSVLGEVTRPGVYPYTMHHRLLDLISAASGLKPTAGRLVDIFHRNDLKTPHPVLLDPNGADPGNHNPELSAGDTVEVSRAGLVYVIGAVVRPGGFAVDPSQGLTVVQALSLAWGPTQTAATHKALLIREQNDGRTIITLNLNRMLHGKEPDLPIRDHDIVFVPDSEAKNLLNRTLESVIQSTIGVTIYSGLVYSQRY